MGQLLLRALLDDQTETAQSLVNYALPQELDDEARELFAFRFSQAGEFPEHAPWLLRAIVLQEERVMVGYANFHGPPGINDTGDPDAVSIGYRIFPEHQGHGYATQAARRLVEWAAEEHGMKHVVCGVAPDNAASMRVLEKLGFRRTNQVIEGEVIFERRG